MEANVEKEQSSWKCVDDEMEWPSLEPRIQSMRNYSGGGSCLSWLSPSTALGGELVVNRVKMRR